MNSQVKTAIGVILAFAIVITLFLYFSPYRRCMRAKAALMEQADPRHPPRLPDCGHLAF